MDLKNISFELRKNSLLLQFNLTKIIMKNLFKVKNSENNKLVIINRTKNKSANGLNFDYYLTVLTKNSFDNLIVNEYYKQVNSINSLFMAKNIANKILQTEIKIF